MHLLCVWVCVLGSMCLLCVWVYAPFVCLGLCVTVYVPVVLGTMYLLCVWVYVPFVSLGLCTFCVFGSMYLLCLWVYAHGHSTGSTGRLTLAPGEKTCDHLTRYIPQTQTRLTDWSWPTERRTVHPEKNKNKLYLTKPLSTFTSCNTRAKSSQIKYYSSIYNA